VFRGPHVEPEEGSRSSRRSPPFGFRPQPEEGADGNDEVSPYIPPLTSIRDLTCCFLRLSNIDNGAFDRLGRYNAGLWKQTAQTLFLLQTIRRPLL
jgi:hypothetical protein